MPAKKTLTVLFFGDVVGKPGRRTVAKVLPLWQAEYKPDLILGNVENLTHGKGVTAKTLTEMKGLGLQAFSGGNHVWAKDDPAKPEIRDNFQLALPANVKQTKVDQRYQAVAVAGQTVYLINLLGREGINFPDIGSALQAFDDLYRELKEPKLIIVDFHAEFTSEKMSAGWYFDGRASLVLGTHTHIPTADARLLDKGAGYITDIGMTGLKNEVLGVKKEIIIDRFLEKEPQAFVWADEGPTTATAILAELDIATGHCLQIQLLQKDFDMV